MADREADVEPQAWTRVVAVMARPEHRRALRCARTSASDHGTIAVLIFAVGTAAAIYGLAYEGRAARR